MDESAQIFVVFDQFFTVTNTCIQECDNFCDNPGDNNIDDYPEFGPGINNYRLRGYSPCLDRGRDAGVPDDDADIDDNNDTNEQLPWDLDTRARFFDAISHFSDDVDMGAYEFQPCPWDIFLPPPYESDCVVDTLDLMLLLANWGSCADCNDCPADFNGDCTVNTSDLLALFANWGPCACGEQQIEPLTLEQELADACLTEDDWDDYMDVMTDEESSQDDKDRYQCWMEHYIRFCNRCTCFGPTGCPNPDPFN